MTFYRVTDMALINFETLNLLLSFLVIFNSKYSSF